MSFRSNVIAAALVAAAAIVSAPEAGAQVATPPDSTVAGRMPTIVSTAEKEGLFRRIWTAQEKRHEVIELDRGNRRLAAQLRAYDRRIVQLEGKLDSLKAREAAMQREIAAIDSATAATRRTRLALEARLREMEEIIAKGGGR